MTPDEARQIVARSELASRELVDAWLAEALHPEVGFLVLARVCCRLLALINEEDRDRFGFALVDDLHHAMGHIYDGDADGYDPWVTPQ